MLKIIDVEYLSNYKLLLKFNDGVNKVVDCSELFTYEVFAPLKDEVKFKQFGLVRGTLEWLDGIDIAPEYLYEIGAVK